MESHESIQAFYLPAPGANESSVKLLDPGPDDATHLELVVIEGGPVFLFDGRMDKADAYRRTRGVDTTDFAIGANSNVKAVMALTRNTAFTVASDQETIGYVRIYRAG